MNLQLNELASQLIEDINESPEDYRIARHDVENNGLLLDFGVITEGGIEAGVALAAICMAGLADVSMAPGMIGDIGWPHVAVETDSPVAACLFSQYAGWKINVGKFFAMGSGPMRAVAAKEELFDKLWYREQADQVVGVLESSKLPDASVFEYIAQATDVEPEDVVLCVAPTSSMAGNLQVVARSIETAMHKLHELGFDVNRVRKCLWDRAVATRGQERSGRNRSHERRHSLRCSSHAVGDGRRRIDRRCRPTRSLNVFRGLWQSVSRHF